MTPNPADPDPRSEGPEDAHGAPDLAYGRLYGRAPRMGGTKRGSVLSTVYTFVLVWLGAAVFMFFGSRLLGIERGDVGAAVVALIASLAAAIAVTVWIRKRR
ncbi:hypothetical protein [Citricoccus sp. GCM10030269]|uniref:hypothetical protein n=1 Tax=Citricoccus sp. GCM10030269 TaxID=3273388 RepID=UPI00360EF005